MQWINKKLMTITHGGTTYDIYSENQHLNNSDFGDMSIDLPTTIHDINKFKAGDILVKDGVYWELLTCDHDRKIYHWRRLSVRSYKTPSESTSE